MPLRRPHRGLRLMLLLAAALCLAAPTARAAVPDARDVTGSVADSTSGEPLLGAEITVQRDGQIIANTIADQFGRFVIHNLAPGAYTVSARFIGYRPQTRAVTIASGGAPVVLAFRLAAAPMNLAAVTVTAVAPVAVDTRTGNQVFNQNNYHGAPIQTTSQILQQSIAGAAQAPTGEVHIRGQHAEYTYYIDGVPVLPGISGSLNELFDPSTVQHIDFQTGEWDAEYGDKNAAIINVTTRVPAGGFHADLSSYAGNYQANGQSLNLSQNIGRWGWFASATRQETALRQNPVVGDTLTGAPVNFHNRGQDLFGFGKVQFVPSRRDAFNLDMNWSETRFQVPFDSVEGVIDDRQRDINSFANLSWHHRFTGASTASERESDLFAAVFLRQGGLRYVPGVDDQPSFIFYPDTTPYNVTEDRSFTTLGTKLDYHFRVGHAASFKTGLQASRTTGHENFSTADAQGNAGPLSNSDLNGHDVGVYAQTVLTPVEWLELRTGVRYDAHTAPFAGTQTQWSPRVRLNVFPNPANTFYAYYGRMFIPTNVEDLRAITSVADSGVGALPTLPERDDFYSLGYIHRFPHGIVAKLSAYHKQSAPGIDDNTVPGTSITTSVNLAKVRVTGIESVVEVRPGGALSGYLNLALSHAYGRGPITGGFFPTDVANVPGRWFDLDHDQRISAVANVVYSPNRFFVSATGIYGSGLTNGANITQPIGTGLFDFNRAIHVPGNFTLDASAGYSFTAGRVLVRPEVYVNNVFNRHYLLKGAFFSGASFDMPRTVQLRLNVSY